MSEDWNNAPDDADSEQVSEHTPAPKYAHYHFETDQIRTETITPPTRKAHRGKKYRPKEENPIGRKIAVTLFLAILFGLVSGAVFVSVNYVSQQYLNPSKEETTASGTSLSADTSVSDSTGSDSAASDEAVSVSAQRKSAQTGTVASVAATALPSVVAITTVSVQEVSGMYGFFYGYGTQEYESKGTGSGIIVGENDDELLIATNNHVVEDATTLTVCFTDPETDDFTDAVSAKIKGTDEDNDLAVVAVQKSDIPDDVKENIVIAQLGNSETLEVGEQVVAIGNALGYGQSVTSGWVSALGRTITFSDGSSAELIQTDAAINPGNSGGALLNMEGEVIGINSAKYADSNVEGMGYAVPISKAEPILEDLMSRQTRDIVEGDEAAYLAIRAADLTNEAVEMYDMPEGVFVIEVASDSGAEAAGLKKGDIIVKLDGQKVSSRSDLVDKLQYYKAGETVDFVIARAGEDGYQEQTIAVTFDRQP